MYVLTNTEGRAFGPRWTNLEDVPERLRDEVLIMDTVPFNCLDALPKATQSVTVVLRSHYHGGKTKEITTTLDRLWDDVGNAAASFDVNIIRIKEFTVSASDDDITISFYNTCYGSNETLECNPHYAEARNFYSDACQELCGGGGISPMRGMEILMVLSCMWEKIRPHTKG